MCSRSCCARRVVRAKRRRNRGVAPIDECQSYGLHRMPRRDITRLLGLRSPHWLRHQRRTNVCLGRRRIRRTILLRMTIRIPTHLRTIRLNLRVIPIHTLRRIRLPSLANTINHTHTQTYNHTHTMSHGHSKTHTRIVASTNSNSVIGIYANAKGRTNRV